MRKLLFSGFPLLLLLFSRTRQLPRCGTGMSTQRRVRSPGPSLPRPKKGVPTGTKPIDQMGWPDDQVEGVKAGADAGPRDWVGVAQR